VLAEFTFKVYGDNQDIAIDELEKFTNAFLQAAGGEWECVEDLVMDDPSWVPGQGPIGKPRGYKAYRKFIPYIEEGGEIMSDEETPTEATEETPAEETPDAPPAEEEAPEDDTPDEETPA
jgi:hypothetical protein